MKILYIAKHGSGGNDDEGAITEALTDLGHEVVRIAEQGYARHLRTPADFALFHKPSTLRYTHRLKMPKCFWYFDLVSSTESGMVRRSVDRVRQVTELTALTDVGFMTDGDWVAADTTGKLVWLSQGADQRILGRGTSVEPPPADVLFVGSVVHGGRRVRCVEALRRRYGDRFLHVGYSGPTRIHGRALADLMGRVPVVVAPDGPSTDLYWSNRVYQALGFGAFLLHPYCERLTGHYTDGAEIVYYRNIDDLFDKIDYYLARPADRRSIALAGLERTRREHTYRHRCAFLVDYMTEVCNARRTADQRPELLEGTSSPGAPGRDAQSGIRNG